MIVLDTNVLSETLRVRPAEPVVRWMQAQPATNLFTTTICEAEILFGIAVMPSSKRRSALEQAVIAIFDDLLGDRVLAFDRSAARSFARIAARRKALGHPISQHDAQIAAIAYSCRSTLATRNVDDFKDCGIEIVNPWDT